MASGRERCLVPMPKSGQPCGRVAGHNGKHASASSQARKRTYARLRYREKPDEARAIAARSYRRGRERVFSMLPPQPDACELCGRSGPVVADHDHGCGPDVCTECFRGWLCSRCNTGLGKLGDTRESLVKALAYFDKPKWELAAKAA